MNTKGNWNLARNRKMTNCEREREGERERERETIQTNKQTCGCKKHRKDKKMGKIKMIFFSLLFGFFTQLGWPQCLATMERRGQFHQHLARSFFGRKFYVPLFVLTF